MRLITKQDHETLFNSFEKDMDEAMGEGMDKAYIRSVDSVGMPVYRVEVGYDTSALDMINSAFLGYCVAKGFTPLIV